MIEARLIDDIFKNSFQLLVILFTKKSTMGAFIFLAVGTAIYWYLMLNEDEIFDWEDDWKKILLGIGSWLVTLIYGIVLGREEFGKINEGETSSKLFVFGLLVLSVAYTVISIKAFLVRENALVLCMATLFMLFYIFAAIGYLVILIWH